MYLLSLSGIFIFIIFDVNGEPECKPFSEIYASGKELCENMWDNSFTYIENNDDEAYTMWFFDDTNPNDQITLNKGLNTTSKCLLNYFHRAEVESSDFQECHPWKEAACCYESTVSDVNTLLNSYGDEYRWDRCGELSQACERFFVQEACFYECDPNVGLYKLNNSDWQIYHMPIKSSYCDAWYRACYNDYFCASDQGSYFSCAKEYQELDNNVINNVTVLVEVEITEKDKSVDVVLIIIIIVIVLIVIGMFTFICYVRNREQKGNPYFAPLDQDGNVDTAGDAEMQGTR